ncbi:putative transcription factor TGA like domain-containing protein [Lupinus albus]|uniref:Putative transcription factor TGA like domain-containing protein n=1 Tax=Lupinus albus TaxID=3870 RepID=A0A6A4NQS0_LUPAL|nr:putative transcription factor TGA like domain-containing protein [Lupinus albus]
MHLFPFPTVSSYPSSICSLFSSTLKTHTLSLSLFFILNTNMNNNPVVEKFSQFYHNWVLKLEEILHLLLEISKKRSNENGEQEMLVLVSKVTSHIKEYYTMKWGAAHEDVLVFFSPVWLNPLENAYLWVTGWKPSTVFKLMESLNKTTTFNMTEEQEKKIEVLRMRIRMEEEKVESEMERKQVALADRKMVELARMCSRVRNDGGGGGGGGDVVVVAEKVDEAMKEVLAGLEKIMKSSDCVRLKTLKGVLDLLTPMQCVYFLAANIAMQLRLKQWNKKTDIGGSIMNHNLISD